MSRRFVAVAGIVALLTSTAARAQLPAPDHIVIVIEENHSAASILGNPDADYINSLTTFGANFTNFSAIQHPSQPNYLQFFSGADQGNKNDDIPDGIPFTTPNLAA